MKHRQAMRPVSTWKDDLVTSLTAFDGWNDLIYSMTHHKYIPTLRVEPHRDSTERALKFAQLRRLLHSNRRPVFPSWGYYPGEKS